MAHLDPLSLEAQNLDYYPTSPCALRVPRVRAPHTIRRETDGEGGAAAAAQRARGARDGGAEQRPLARSLLRLCQRHALCPSTERA